MAVMMSDILESLSIGVFQVDSIYRHHVSEILRTGYANDSNNLHIGTDAVFGVDWLLH
jgi:hypothetical protein